MLPVYFWLAEREAIQMFLSFYENIELALAEIRPDLFATATEGDWAS